MRRFLVCSGIYGSAEALNRLETSILRRHPDGVLFAGGVLARWRECATNAPSEFAYTKPQALFVERFFATLGRSGVFSAIIPGLFDAPLDLFLRAGMVAELQYPNLHLVHGTPVVAGDVAVFGLGACIDDYTNTDIGYYSLTQAKYYLRPLWVARQPRTILLLSEPPEMWHGDAENRRFADTLIATYRPSVCVFGRPDGRQSVKRLAGTRIIAPGALADCHAAWLDWDHHAGDQVVLLTGDDTTREPRLLGGSLDVVAEVVAGAGRTGCPGVAERSGGAAPIAGPGSLCGSN